MQFRCEKDSMGEVEIPANVLWGAQTQRALQHFSIGNERMPVQMITALALVKKACADVSFSERRIEKEKHELIIQVCDEILDGEHDEMFPLHVWISGSGTQFNMNMNEVIANRCSQLAGEEVGSKRPVHPNDDVNKGQSTNDAFPSAMCIAAAIGVQHELLPALVLLRDALYKKARAWESIVKIGRTHLQDATPMTLGQEFSGYARMLTDSIDRIERTREELYPLAIGGTAVGTGLNATPHFGVKVSAVISALTGLPFCAAENRFAVQGAHDALVQLSGTLKTLATSLYKIANDIRLLACGPRAGIGELQLPANEPGSSIMPGKVNPTQCEALSMIALQVMAHDTAVGMGNAGGHLEMNAYKPLIIYNVMNAIELLAGGMRHFTAYCIEGIEPNLKQIDAYLARSLMCVTALAPVIGYDKAAQIAHHAHEQEISLKEAAIGLGHVTEEEFDAHVIPARMTAPELNDR